MYLLKRFEEKKGKRKFNIVVVLIFLNFHYIFKKKSLKTLCI